MASQEAIMRRASTPGAVPSRFRWPSSLALPALAVVSLAACGGGQEQAGAAGASSGSGAGASAGAAGGGAGGAGAAGGSAPGAGGGIARCGGEGEHLAFQRQI